MKFLKRLEKFYVKGSKVKEESVKSILFITLSNLGDVILTTPVLEKLCELFPDAKVDVITSSFGKDVFILHPSVRGITVRPSRPSMVKRLKDIKRLRLKRYDLAVDLKNSLVPYLIGAKLHSRLDLFPFKKELRHKTEEHLSKLSFLDMDAFSEMKFFISSSDDEKSHARDLLSAPGKNIVINPGAKSHLKRWPPEKYASLSDRLVRELACNIFITGSDNDKETVKSFSASAKEKFTDLSSKTSLGLLTEVVRKADLVITNDSAPLHVASAVGTPAVAIFGPSDERKYGPLSKGSITVKPEVPCRPCERALCSEGLEEGCIQKVTAEEVFENAKKILTD